MFDYIRGPAFQRAPHYVAVEANGLAYKIYIPKSHFEKLPADGTEVKLYLSLVIREMSQTVYGFENMQLRDVFEILISVNGVGPKMALNLVGHLSLDDMRSAFYQENSTLLCQVPGVGKKTAERLIVEVRSKIPALVALIGESKKGSALPAKPMANPDPLMRDALGALTNLGYPASAAEQALERIIQQTADTKNLDLPSLITKALQQI